jgi:Ca2+-binding RTX toxin-like protein
MSLLGKGKMRHNRQVRRLSVEPLENRELLSINLVGTELQVLGTSGADTAQVWESGDVIYAELNGARQHWGSWTVRSLRFSGDAGDDSFTNSTNLPTTAYGDAGNDRITGGTGNDTLDGGDGNDVLDGVAGNDTVRGRSGDDSLEGGDGDDVLYGDDGNDSIHGEAGNDSVYGGTGNDVLYGDDGDDYLRGDSGNDYVSGQNGADRVYGNDGDDTLYGGNDNDNVYGGNGRDTAYGGAGNDYLYGNANDDVLSGEAGDDRLYGGDGDDRLSGNAGADRLYGDANNDVLLGGDGSDTMDGGNGNDTLNGEAGNDTLSGGSGDDRLQGGAGGDTLRGGEGRDGLFGGADDTADTLRGDAGDDRFLYRDHDTLSDRGDSDVRIKFVDGSDHWTDAEVAQVDQAFLELQDRTGTTRILKDTTCEGPLVFVKDDRDPDWSGLNETWWSPSHSAWKRRIHMGEWDESDDDANWWARATAIHEIGHNWDSYDEGDHFPDGDGYWHDFVDAHIDSTRSHNDDWVRRYGEENRHEDWCTCWEATMGYRTGEFPDTPSAVLTQKLAIVDDFFARFV